MTQPSVNDELTAYALTALSHSLAYFSRLASFPHLKLKFAGTCKMVSVSLHQGWSALALACLLIDTILPTTALPAGDQQPITQWFDAAEQQHGRNYSVGFSLQSSFGAAAVILDWPDGHHETLTRVIHGGTEYERVMATLSLASSRHTA